ncbi:STAS domain-containing protein [bacterium AH-315-F18]|nr:STAS domain-containing protein [bacterium AH-315-F18]
MPADQTIPMQVIRGCLVVSFSNTTGVSTLDDFRGELLTLVTRSRVGHVVFDFSEVALIDLNEFSSVQKCAAMIGLLGAQTVLAGLNPNVVATLVSFGAHNDGMETALSVELALEKIDLQTRTSLESA